MIMMLFFCQTESRTRIVCKTFCKINIDRHQPTKPVGMKNHQQI